MQQCSDINIALLLDLEHADFHGKHDNGDFYVSKVDIFIKFFVKFDDCYMNTMLFYSG